MTYYLRVIEINNTMNLKTYVNFRKELFVNCRPSDISAAIWFLLQRAEGLKSSKKDFNTKLKRKITYISNDPHWCFPRS